MFPVHVAHWMTLPDGPPGVPLPVPRDAPAAGVRRGLEGLVLRAERLRDAHTRGEGVHDQRPGALASTRAGAGGHGLQVLAVFTSGEDCHLQLLMLLTLAGARGAKCLS